MVDVEKRSFTWERGPFEECPLCRRETYGLLSAGGSAMTLRCTQSDCRCSETVTLPPVEKVVVYLDQNAFSVLFQAQRNGRLPIGHEEACLELLRLSQRALYLQQVVFPHSNIHHDETIVFREAQELREAYEFMGGDARLSSTHDIELNQAAEYARARLEGREPQLSFEVDEVMASPRNRWLSDMHISVRADYSRFAPALRASRDRAHEGMTRLAATWAKEQPSFQEVLDRERAAYGKAKVGVFFQTLTDYGTATESGDVQGVINSSLSHIMDEHRALEHVFKKAGVPENECTEHVIDFWLSEEARHQPMHDIEAHLFAAFARRIGRGQRKFTRGLSNDIRAIAAYGPYVDAMFLDKEFEIILKETPELRKLPLKAKIFSFASLDEFLGSLNDLCERTPADVRKYASRIYHVS